MILDIILYPGEELFRWVQFVFDVLNLRCHLDMVLGVGLNVYFQSNAALVNGVGNTVNGASAFVSRTTILGICHGKVPIFFGLIFYSKHAMKGQSELQHQ